MKNIIKLLGSIALTVFFVFALTVCGNSGSGDPSSPPGPATSTVLIGVQSGTLTSGTASSVTFPVTTANIANGQSGTITLYSNAAGTMQLTMTPYGLTTRTVSNVSGNAATVTMGTNSSAAAQTIYFRVTFDSVQSNVGTLVILPGTPTVSIGAQSGTLTSGTASSVTFPVTTANIANGQSGTITLYSDAAGTMQLMMTPYGLTTRTVSNVSGNAAIVTMGTNSSAAAQTIYFRVTFDSVQSDVGTLVISP